MKDGRTITVPLTWYPRLLDATPEQRMNWKIAGGGYGIHWPDLDEDLSTEGLLRGAPAPRKARQSSAAAPHNLFQISIDFLQTFFSSLRINKRQSSSVYIRVPARPAKGAVFHGQSQVSTQASPSETGPHANVYGRHAHHPGRGRGRKYGRIQRA
jgi:hypothetical protein